MSFETHNRECAVLNIPSINAKGALLRIDIMECKCKSVDRKMLLAELIEYYKTKVRMAEADNDYEIYIHYYHYFCSAFFENKKEFTDITIQCPYFNYQYLDVSFKKFRIVLASVYPDIPKERLIALAVTFILKQILILCTTHIVTNKVIEMMVESQTNILLQIKKV